MITVYDIFEDVDGLEYAHVEEDGRFCYYLLSGEEIKGIKDLPYIENASISMQFLWNAIINSENCMYFVDEDNIYDVLNYLGISREEFIKQVSDDVIKYQLQDVVEFGDDYIVACYGMFQQSFTGKVIDIKW